MCDEMTLSSWQLAYELGRFLPKDRKTQIEAGWYDWFCSTESLAARTKKMGKIVARITDEGKVNRSKTYVFFKNNCPVSGPLFDDFRICDIETGDVLFTTRIDSCWNQHKYAVYGRTLPDLEWQDDPLFECDDMRDLVTWFNTPWNMEVTKKWEK